MVKLEVGFTGDDIKEIIEAHIREEKKRLLWEKKRSLIRQSVEDDKDGGVVSAGRFDEPLYSDLAGHISEKDAVPDDALIQEVHIEVGQPVTVRYEIPPDAPDSVPRSVKEGESGVEKFEGEEVSKGP